MIEDSKKMIGFEVWMEGFPPSSRLSPPLDLFAIKEFTNMYGDDNPLYTDPDYAKNTRYGCLIAPPTITNGVKYPVTRGVLDWGPYPFAGFPAQVSWEWYDVFRVYDRTLTSMKADEVFEKKGRTGGLVFTNLDTSMWNQSEKLIATGEGMFISVAREGYVEGEGMTGSGGMLYERPTTHYSEDEVEKIVNAYDNEKRRGATPLYWEDVKIGEKLQTVVKGPSTFMDFLGGETGRSIGRLRVTYPSFEGGLAGEGEQPRKNPVTGWPYESRWMEHYDFNLCKGRGLPGPFDLGVVRCTETMHLISNWMGDDGFLKRLTSSIRKPHYYGDTNWFSGEVIKVYKDNVEGVEYGAVDVIISVINEVGENDLPGKATVYLPSRELGEVALPVPTPSPENWKLTTKRDAKDFLNEIESGETIFPWLPSVMNDYYGWLNSQSR